MAQEKIRVYALAKMLNMESMDLLKLCQQHGIDVKNQLSSLDPEQRDQIEALVKRGASAQPAAPARVTPPPMPKTDRRVITNLESRRAAGPASAPTPAGALTPGAPEAPAVPEVPAAAAAPVESPRPAETKPIPAPVPPAAEAPPTPVPPTEPATQTPPPSELPPARAPEQPAATRPPTPPPTPEPPRPAAVPPAPPRPMRNLSGGPVRPTTARPPERKPPSAQPAPRPTSAPRMATPPTPRAKTGGEDKKPPPPPATGPRKLADIPPELADSGKPIRIEDLLKPLNRPGGTTTTVTPTDADAEGDEEGRDKGGKKRPGGVAGRDQRHSQRQARAKDRQAREAGGGKTLLIDDDTPQAKRLIHLKRKQKQQPTQPRKGKVPIELPITVRSLSAAMSMQAGKLLMKLMEHGVTATINSTLDPDLAEALALDQGCELDVKRPPDAEEMLQQEMEKPDAPESLLPRAPIVTIMGHVDHGKTSLLDRIRQSNIVATEAGGITQVLRAWRVEHNGKPITFLDTPGHEAFTKMRARGANVTDIAVIVVAATDGVMPQTEEAISHAKAAEVAIIVAINKVDLPNANVRRTEQQLYNLGLIPDNMGGDVPFVQTSALTGKGVDDLLENISVVAELQELKANPNKSAHGTCLEASVSEGEGVLATLLVQDGTLRKGDVVLCGAAHGRVRALYDDLGRPIEAAGPSVPCRITGLDEIPNADDPFVVVEDLVTARDIAEKRNNKMQEASLVARAPLDLGALMQTKATELKVVLKADVRGSVEAIKKELEKLQHDEVRLRVLHTGIGAINESDVTLALISPQDTLVVGFNVVPDDPARALAEERGVQIREYNIIYKLTDDLRSALEGKLKPKEEIVHLGRAVVRETFKISRVGTIAGCRVTQGAIERAAKVRVIRNGIVIYPPPDRTVGLDSLKHHKDDAKEIKQGYECGMKITGFDDVKVDDVIECYRVDQVQRTLS